MRPPCPVRSRKSLEFVLRRSDQRRSSEAFPETRQFLRQSRPSSWAPHGMVYSGFFAWGMGVGGAMIATPRDCLRRRIMPHLLYQLTRGYHETLGFDESGDGLLRGSLPRMVKSTRTDFMAAGW